MAAVVRQFVVWLNNESLELGGRLVNPWPLQYVQYLVLSVVVSHFLLSKREIFVYYANLEWEKVRT